MKWRELSRAAKKVWANAVDEPGDHRYSLVPDAVNPNHDNARQNALWGALMAGAWGIEWYFGYEHAHSDLTCEDWRTRENMWVQSKYALDFFTQNDVPYWEMEPLDELTSNDDYVLAKPNDTYIIYMKMGPKDITKINELDGSYQLSWFNPRIGEFVGDKKIINSNDGISIPPPSTEAQKDWVALIKKIN